MALDSARHKTAYGWIASGERLEAEVRSNGERMFASIEVDGQPIRLTIAKGGDKIEARFFYVQELADYLESKTQLRMRDFKAVAN